MTYFARALLASTMALAVAAPLLAHGTTRGAISIGHPWARETVQGQAAGGAFMTITNGGRIVDKLVGGSSPMAAEVQVHSMVMDGGIMRMRRLTDGLAIPAGGSVELKPGSYHIMLMGLKGPFKAGTIVPVTLKFQHAGNVQVRFAVQPMGAGNAPLAKGAMSHDHHAH